MEIEDNETTKFLKVTNKFTGPNNVNECTFNFGVRELNTQQMLGKFVTSMEKDKNGVVSKAFSVEIGSSLENDLRTVTFSVTGFGNSQNPSPVQYEARIDAGAGKYGGMLLGGFQYPDGPRQFLQVKVESTAGATLKKYIVDVAVDGDYKQQNGAAIQAKGTFAYRFNSVSDFEVYRIH